jgi:hypothetical protein
MLKRHSERGIPVAVIEMHKVLVACGSKLSARQQRRAARLREKIEALKKQLAQLLDAG